MNLDQRCPYTGAPLEVVSTENGDYRVQGAYDPAQWFDTEGELVAAVSMRGGAPRTYKVLKCPYTGKKITPVLNERLGKWQASGAWSPNRVYSCPWALKYDVSIRNGVKPSFSRERPAITLTEREHLPDNPVSDLGHIGDQAMERIEELIG